MVTDIHVKYLSIQIGTDHNSTDESRIFSWGRNQKNARHAVLCVSKAIEMSYCV